jgi:hypothetical protein
MQKTFRLEATRAQCIGFRHIWTNTRFSFWEGLRVFPVSTVLKAIRNPFCPRVRIGDVLSKGQGKKHHEDNMTKTRSKGPAMSFDSYLI